MKQKLLLVISLITFNLSISQDFTKIPIDATFGFTRGIEIADLNNDNNIDVVALTIDDTPEVACWFSDGNGNFGSKEIIDNSLDDFGGKGDDINVLDVNNDGFSDIIVSVQISFDNKIVWYQNNQDGTFGTANIIDSGGRTSNVILIFDADNNGFDDIVISYQNIPPNNGNDVSTYYYPNSGNGSFGSRVLIDHSFARGMTANLFDNDGFNDLIFTTLGSSIDILVNNGNGTFTSPVNIDNSFSANFIESAKIDNDNFFDIVVSGISSDETLVWYSGNNDGTFDSFSTISTMEYVQISHIDIDDIDNDGDNDVVATAFSSTDLLWWENDGNGNFGSTQIVNSETTGNYDVKIVDVDEDGKKDIVMSNATGLYWFKNNLTLSTIDSSFEKNLLVYPNPSDGQIIVKSNVPINKIILYDTLGKLITVFRVDDLSTTININSNGLYFAKVITEAGVYIKKIIIN